MHLAFYVANTGTWYDRLVAKCSRPGVYSHCEIRFRDGAFFSSSPRDGGCRFKYIPLDYHWDLVELPFTESEEEVIRDICRSYCKPSRYKYDWCGVFRFLFPFIPIKLSRHRRFCSEVCVQVCQFNPPYDWWRGYSPVQHAEIALFHGIEPRYVSPNELARMARAVRDEAKKEAA